MSDLTELKGRIYIAGGFNGQECLNSAESYDPVSNQWTMLTPMLYRRSGVGIIAYDNSVFAVGGFDGLQRLLNAERYNIATNTWSLVADMYNPRSNFAIEVCSLIRQRNFIELITLLFYFVIVYFDKKYFIS